MTFQASEERNYHIFYQLCASREEEDLAHLHLDEPEEFLYLNHGECTEIDGVDDAKELESTKQALNTLGMTSLTRVQSPQIYDDFSAFKCDLLKICHHSISCDGVFGGGVVSSVLLLLNEADVCGLFKIW